MQPMTKSMNSNNEKTGKHLGNAFKMLISWVILSGFLVLAYGVSYYFAWTFPPALSAMLALFAALQFKVIKLDWLTPGANPLLNFMPLFFVPAAAKVVEHSAIISQHWLVLALCLLLVPMCGLMCIGLIMQRLGKSS